MKFLLPALCTTIIVLVNHTAFKTKNDKNDITAYQELIKKKKYTLINCAPDWSTYNLSKEDVQQMIPLPGTGSHSWKISTDDDSAQFYFNQGINLYYGFHIVEAL